MISGRLRSRNAWEGDRFSFIVSEKPQNRNSLERAHTHTIIPAAYWGQLQHEPIGKLLSIPVHIKGYTLESLLFDIKARKEGIERPLHMACPRNRVRISPSTDVDHEV